MSDIITAVRGMKDILPDESPLWHWLEKIFLEILLQYGYQEIRVPIVEKTQLFKRAVGEVTDIVEKEMYSFDDRNGENLSLRPELTAGCIRAGIEHSLFYNQIAKLWYYGPLFRHERPQRGRYRQFYQLGVELCGIAEPYADAEVILLSARLLKNLGLLDHVTLQLNSLGHLEDRKNYRDILVAYFTKQADQLDEDSQRRLTTNPLRILDSKNPDMQELIRHAPKITDHLSPSAQQHFKTICDILDAEGIAYQINPTLVRGLDYYCLTVFEWVTDKLGAQGTVCAGGRYDGLIEQLGGKPCPGIGFAMGVERALALIEDLGTKANNYHENPHIYVFASDDVKAAICLSEKIRTEWQLPQHRCRVLTSLMPGSFKSQMKKADNSDAQIALILGEEEIKNKTVTVKYLRENKPQETVAESEVLNILHNEAVQRSWEI